MAGEQLAALIAQQPGLMLQAGLSGHQLANQRMAQDMRGREAITQALLQSLGLASQIQGQERELAQGERRLGQEDQRIEIARKESATRSEAQDLANRLGKMEIAEREAMLKAMPPEWRAGVQKELLEIERTKAESDSTRAGAQARLATSEANFNEMTTEQRMAFLQEQVSSMRAQTEATRTGTERERLMMPGAVEQQGLQNQSMRQGLEQGEQRFAMEQEAHASNIDRMTTLNALADQQLEAGGYDFARRKKADAVGDREVVRESSFRSRLRSAKTPEERQGVLMEDPQFAASYALQEAEFRRRVQLASMTQRGGQATPADLQEMASGVYNEMLETILTSVSSLEQKYEGKEGGLMAWGTAQERLMYEQMVKQLSALRAIGDDVANPGSSVYSSGMVGGESIVQQLLNQALGTPMAAPESAPPGRPRNR